MITSSTTSAAAQTVPAFLQEASNPTTAPEAPHPPARDGLPQVQIVKTTFFGESPWAVLHLAAENTRAETTPRTRIKSGTKAKRAQRA